MHKNSNVQKAGTCVAFSLWCVISWNPNFYQLYVKTQLKGDI